MYIDRESSGFLRREGIIDNLGLYIDEKKSPDVVSANDCICHGRIDEIDDLTSNYDHDHGLFDICSKSRLSF